MIVLVGGPSGIGKSTLVDALISRTDRQFARPRSYTTRPPRVGETRGEYVHVSAAEFQELSARGAFVTVDKVFGHSYAMTYDSIRAIQREGQTVVKEVDPRNHAKLSALLDGVVPVLLLPADLKTWFEEVASEATRADRGSEEREFYEALVERSDTNGIVLRIGRPRSPDAIAGELVAALDRHAARHAATEVELRNRIGYDLIAPEFSDELRVTTANFHDLTGTFFSLHLPRALAQGKRILDVGAGRGHLMPLLRRSGAKSVSLDLSKAMLDLLQDAVQGSHAVCGSAFRLPFARESFDAVVASLADPFLRAESLNEVMRVLRPGGYFLFTSPSRIWSDAARDARAKSKETTTFVDSAGRRATVYSFTYFDTDLRALVSGTGFEIRFFGVAYGSELKGFARPVSAALTRAADQLGTSLRELPIVQMVAAAKPRSAGG